MNPDTGRIIQLEPDAKETLVEQLRKLGESAENLIPLTEETAAALLPLPEAERPGAFLDLIAKHPLARHAATSDEDIQKIRNRLKAERRERAGK